MPGFYDTWVARDICGTPLDGRWPYVTDRLSQQAVRDLKPFPVSSCWNGAVVFNSRPFLYGANLSDFTSTSPELLRRGWRRIDDGRLSSHICCAILTYQPWTISRSFPLLSRCLSASDRRKSRRAITPKPSCSHTTFIVFTTRSRADQGYSSTQLSKSHTRKSGSTGIMSFFAVPLSSGGLVSRMRW
jgi:hypothetical protein